MESDSIKDAADDVEERTALEDVFRFDSEMTHEDTEDKACLIANSAPRKNVSVEDLNDALIDETDDSEAEGVTIRRRKESTDNDEDFKKLTNRMQTFNSNIVGSNAYFWK